MLKKIIIILSFIMSVSNLAMAESANTTIPQAKYFTQITLDAPDFIQYGNNEKNGFYVKSNDAQLYYEVYGEGQPLLVLHGGQVGSIYEMKELIAELSKNYKVIAMSTRGHGKSELGHSEITYDQRAEDAIKVIDKVTKEPVIVLGFSDGAYTGYKLASKYPQKVSKLIAIGAGENIDNLRKVPQLTVDGIRKIDSEYVEYQLAIMPEPHRWQESLDSVSAYNKNLIADKKLFMSIQCPTLVMAGDSDPNAPLDTVISAYKMIPNSKLAIISNAGHTAFINNFDAVYAQIRDFLNY